MIRCVVRLLPVVTLVYEPHVRANVRGTSSFSLGAPLVYTRCSGSGYEEEDATTGRGGLVTASAQKIRRLTSADRKRGGHTDRQIVVVVRTCGGGGGDGEAVAAAAAIYPAAPPHHRDAPYRPTPIPIGLPHENIITIIIIIIDYCNLLVIILLVIYYHYY